MSNIQRTDHVSHEHVPESPKDRMDRQKLREKVEQVNRDAWIKYNEFAIEDPERAEKFKASMVKEYGPPPAFLREPSSSKGATVGKKRKFTEFRAKSGETSVAPLSKTTKNKILSMGDVFKPVLQSWEEISEGASLKGRVKERKQSTTVGKTQAAATAARKPETKPE
jgi:hypothetical protein